VELVLTAMTEPSSRRHEDNIDLIASRKSYKEFKIGTQIYKRYSPKAIEKINAALQQEQAEAIWAKRHPKTVTP
jgi:hypothetical protein